MLEKHIQGQGTVDGGLLDHVTRLDIRSRFTNLLHKYVNIVSRYYLETPCSNNII